MKKLVFLCMFMATMLASFGQTTTMTPPSGSVDSATVKYLTVTVSNGGVMVIQPVITKVANTGSTVAGYCLLQGSVDGTNFVNVPTWKSAKYAATAQYNLYDTDTFTLTNVTTAQTKAWEVGNYDGTGNIYSYYRVAVVMTTTKVTATGKVFIKPRN